jgi:hypothetical protein
VAKELPPRARSTGVSCLAMSVLSIASTGRQRCRFSKSAGACCEWRNPALREVRYRATIGALHAGASRVGSLLILRLIARRAGNISTPFEFILLFLLGGIGMQAVIADERLLTNALLGICSIGLMQLLTATLKQHLDRLGKLIDGTPVMIVEEPVARRTAKRCRYHRQSAACTSQQQREPAASKIRMRNRPGQEQSPAPKAWRAVPSRRRRRYP